jgi:2-polyprenyl-3-methyl-5-hydroxy-6-metoxy-1,4-benzoquinol methylase
MSDDIHENNLKVRHAWNTNAHFWDERMGEGNEFLNVLIWPVVERLMNVQPGARLLDIACGNGVTSRRLAAMGASVVAVDFAEELIDLAKKRSSTPEIDYRVIDATDYAALLSLGEASFTGALCNMAIMDMADIRPLMTALARVLIPDSAFVFSILHPCFNNPASIKVSEIEDREGKFETTYSVKTSRYLTPFTRPGSAMLGQPVPHPYFHRSLETLVSISCQAGFVLDALEERAFPQDHPASSSPLSWSGLFSEIPPILVVRMKLMPHKSA